jgi:hypothetical protein
VVQTPAVRRRLITGVPVLLAALLALPGGGVPATAQSGASVVRLAGDTRIETAIAISVDSFGAGEADAVVLARSDVFADALAGGPLAAATGAPLLLTTSTQLVPAVRDELQRVLPAGRTVYVLGGPAALSASVEATIAELGWTPRRLQGPSRYDTSLAIAREAAPTPGFITVATGNDFPDALIAGSLATAFADGVMVLSDGSSLTAPVRDYLAEHAAADQTTVGPAAAAAHPGVYNVGGATPVERSVAAAEVFYAGLAPTGVALASVERFPDGLAGAAHAFRSGTLPLLLTPADALPAATAEHIRSLDAAGPSYIYGGPVAVGDDVERALQAALDG